MPHALEASPKQTSTVLESNFRSKSDWSIVQDFLLKSSLLTSRPSRFSASLNHGDTFASWHIWDNMTLRWGKLGNVLMWSSSDLAMWKVNEVMLGPKVIWKRMKAQCNNGRKSILLVNSYVWTVAFYEMFLKIVTLEMWKNNVPSELISAHCEQRKRLLIHRCQWIIHRVQIGRSIVCFD